MSEVEYVELHGERIAYREAGHGDEVVVLIHGMAGCSDTWQAIIPQLARSMRVIAPDLLGHGRSDKPRTDYSLGAFAAGLRDLFDELGLSRVTLVGHSLGGGVAMQFLYQHPEYCRRLILISSGGLGPDVGWILRLLSAPGAEFVLPVFVPTMVPSIGERVGPWLSGIGTRFPRADQIWQAYRSLADPPTRAAFLRTLRSVVDYRGQSVSALNRLALRAEVPTLVIWGDRDPIIPFEHGYEAQVARPTTQLTVLPGLGHFPHVEAPVEVATVIEDFINGTAHRITSDLAATLKMRGGIDSAVGILMALRGCSQRDAAGELADAARETGTSLDDVSQALARMASGDDDEPPGGSQARRRWGHLMAARGLDGGGSSTAIADAVRIRYGPSNTTTFC